jgi:UDP-N-acetyl-D-glucosamine dehydrogenase
LHVSENFSNLGDADAIIACVPTPLDEHRQPDLSYVEKTAEAVAATLRPGQLAIFESTSYPGTTREIVLPILEKTGLKLGVDFFLAYSSERQEPGRVTPSFTQIPKVVGGVDPTGGALACKLYAEIVDKVVPVSSAEIAEAGKILENIYRCVNIALVNEMKMIFDKMGIDVWEVIAAASTKPFGFQPFYPGPGMGGHCIPIDPFYLTWKAAQYEVPARFIELAGEINWRMPEYVLEKLTEGLNRSAKAIAKSKVLVIGAAYKKNVDDVRESPSLHLIEKLIEKGAVVEYHDPHVPQLPKTRVRHLKLQSQDLTEKRLKESDAVLILTDHDAVDWRMVSRCANLIVDTRNVMASIPVEASKLIKA